jgi:hypothetical protein
MIYLDKLKTKLHGLSPRANYTDLATAACRRSECQFLRIEVATWSAWRIPTAVFSVWFTSIHLYILWDYVKKAVQTHDYVVFIVS